MKQVFFIIVSFLCCASTAYCGHAPKEKISEKRSIVYASHDGGGFFADFQVVLGMLELFTRGKFKAVEVDLGKTGFYYDASKGRNWWNYYFEPIRRYRKHKYLRKMIPITNKKYKLMTKFDNIGRHLDRHRANWLISRYIHLRPEYNAEANSFIAQRMQGRPYIAVHYRGTDKQGSESYPVSREEICEQIKALVCVGPYRNHLIFVATDEDKFIRLMQKEFGDRVIYMSNIRSSDGNSFHQRTDLSGYQKGKEALLDCLVLSRSSFLFRTASNLSNVALFLNPDLPSMCVNER